MKLTNLLYRSARFANTISAMGSGNPKRMVRRGKNIIKGRVLARIGFWRALWK